MLFIEDKKMKSSIDWFISHTHATRMLGNFTFSKLTRFPLTRFNLFIAVLFLNFACTSDSNRVNIMDQQQQTLKNEQLRTYAFLEDMYSDDYYPNHVVDKGKAILVTFCHQIEQTQAKDLAALYKLSHAATEQFNDLQEDFENNDSELETGARECIAQDFAFIASAYGFVNADIEELIATRDW